MSSALLDQLLAGFVATATNLKFEARPAKVAIAANPRAILGPASASTTCEEPRIAANGRQAQGWCSHDFAVVRSGQPSLTGGHSCGSSQVSRDSQGDAGAEIDEARYLARRDRLLRWGWPAPEAEAMAQRLVRRDVEADDRVSCAADCAHYRPGRCGNHRRAGLHSPDVGRDLAGLLQRCPGFQAER